MSSNSGLSLPGSSTYASNTLHVGDGTWDSSRDTFLLPNLMGLNFETMRYNGMGNRFRDWKEYHSLILAHGVIAAIVFLGLVPLSLLTVRYYSRWNAFWAFKLHAWFEVLTLFLTTVLFVLGYFAVGPERSLTNPHHGIGVAIYVLVIFQVLWGWFVHKRERAKLRHHVPLKLVIHRWLGWALAILGIVQIALGLTLYGSPKVLFILYSVGAFALLAAFFVLSYMYDSEGYYMGSDYDSRHSYMSGPSVVEDNHHSNFGRMAAAGVAGAGLAQAFRRRPRSRNGDRVYDNSHASYIDEKDSDDGPRRSGWGKRLLEIGAIAGAATAAKKIFDRRRARNADNESGRYSRAHTRSDSMSEATMSRLEEGRPPSSHQAPLNRPPTGPQLPGPVEGSYEESSFITNENAGPSHGFRNALLGAGAFAAIKNMFGRGKAKDEKRRVEEIQRRDAEEERIARANSKKYTGDGFFPRRNDRPASFTATDISSTVITQPTSGPAYGRPVASGVVHSQPSDIPPIPPIHGETVSDATPVPYPGQGGEADTASLTDAAAGAAAGAAGAAAIGSGATRRRRISGRQDDEHVESPPVSVKLKMHNDGRHVTLRRLTEEEAAASREARRRERHGSRRRHGSASSLSGTESGASRWRRVEEMERQQAEQLQREQAAAAAAAAARPTTGYPADPANSAGNTPPEAYIPPPMPPPPPAPSSLPYGAGSITSPGTWTGTDASGDYANNRRRRRAERARARQERQQQHGVEFT